MPTRSINALRLFARRAIALPSLTGSSLYRDPSSLQVFGNSGSRRWFAKEARSDGPRYRNRTRHFKQTIDETPSEEVTSGGIDEQSPTVSFAPEELVPSRPMLERIVKDLKEEGNVFILPISEESIEEVLEPFRQLNNIGVKPEFIIRGCIARPELFRLLVTKARDTMTALSNLVEICRMSYEDALRLISCYPEVVAAKTGSLQYALDALIICGVPAGRQLGSLIKRCPALLFARPPEELKQAAEALGDFFSRKQVSMIIQRCPDVLLKNVDEINDKYEYIFFQMGLDAEEFIDCAKWGSLPLEEIIQRHEFLVKCGVFRTPDAKHPQLSMENPSLRNILDSKDDNFAIQVAQVTPEEWIIYRAYCAKSAEIETKEFPFARVKPSMRKAYERRRKEAAAVPEHVFDVSASSRI